MLTLYRRHLASCPHTSRRDRRCRCPIWVDGSLKNVRVNRSLDLVSWEAAAKLVHQWEASGTFDQEVSLAEACQSFMDDVEVRLRAATVKKYRVLTRQLLDHFGNPLLSTIKTDDLRKLRTTWTDNSLSASKKLERLRSFFKFCADSDWIRTNPARAVKAAPVVEPPPVPFTDEELDRLFTQCDDFRFSVLLHVLLNTGLRISDAIQLGPSKVHNGKLYLRTAKTSTPVWLPLPPHL